MSIRAVTSAARQQRPQVPETWQRIDAAAPQLAATMLAYPDQIAVSLTPTHGERGGDRPADLRRVPHDHDLTVAAVADIDRSHIEAFKVWQHAQPGNHGPLKASTFRRRIGMPRMFFVRIVEWGWDDAPVRVPIFFGDVPERDEPLPRFLDDATYTRFMRALATEPRLHRRVAIELLARTGMRVGELCDLEADAITVIGDAHWRRIPLGKLHNDRYVPLHPHLVELLADYRQSDGPH